jgi:hypothetical protein
VRRRAHLLRHRQPLQGKGHTYVLIVHALLLAYLPLLPPDLPSQTHTKHVHTCAHTPSTKTFIRAHKGVLVGYVVGGLGTTRSTARLCCTSLLQHCAALGNNNHHLAALHSTGTTTISTGTASHSIRVAFII